MVSPQTNAIHYSLIKKVHPNKDAYGPTQHDKGQDSSSRLVPHSDGRFHPVIVTMCPCRRVAFGNTARAVRRRRVDILNQEARHGAKDIHLLPCTARLIDGRVDELSSIPVKPTDTPRVSACALVDGSLGRLSKYGKDLVFGVWRHLSYNREPSVNVALE